MEMNCTWVEKLSIFKMSTHFRLVNTKIRILRLLHRNSQTDSKIYLEKQRIWKSANFVEEKQDGSTDIT